MNRSDFEMLELLKNNNCNNELRSYTIKDIKEKTNYSISKIRNSIKILKAYDYIIEGSNCGRMKSYYISKLGIDKLLELEN